MAGRRFGRIATNGYVGEDGKDFALVVDKAGVVPKCGGACGGEDWRLVVWERAAAEGSAPAARAIGRFYDPRLAPGEPSPFKSPDVERARAFYAKAARLGDGEAQSLFDALDATAGSGGQG